MACPVQAQGVPSRSPESWRKAQRSRGFAVLPRVRCSKHLKTRKKAETGKFWGCRGTPITLLPALEAHRHGTLPNANADGGDLLCSQRKEMQLQVQPVQPFWGENHSIFWKVWHPHPGHVNRTALCKPKDVIGSNVKCDNEMRCPTKQRCTDLIIENLWKSAWVQEVWTRRQERSPSILRTRFHWLRQSLLQCFLAGWGKQFWNYFLPSFWFILDILKTSQDISRRLKTSQDLSKNCAACSRPRVRRRLIKRLTTASPGKTTATEAGWASEPRVGGMLRAAEVLTWWTTAGVGLNTFAETTG